MTQANLTSAKQSRPAEPALQASDAQLDPHERRELASLRHYDRHKVAFVAGGSAAMALFQGLNTTEGLQPQLWPAGGYLAGEEADATGEHGMEQLARYVLERREPVSGEVLFNRARELRLRSSTAVESFYDLPQATRLAYEIFARTVRFVGEELEKAEAHDRQASESLKPPTTPELEEKIGAKEKGLSERTLEGLPPARDHQSGAPAAGRQRTAKRSDPNTVPLTNPKPGKGGKGKDQ